ncbi:MAG: DUF6782 family putative metallopeptidase [Trueperaceae bacterium]
MLARLARVLAALALVSLVAWCASDGPVATSTTARESGESSVGAAEGFAQADASTIGFTVLRYPPEQVRVYLKRWSPQFPGLCLFPAWNGTPIDPESVLADVASMVAAEPTVGEPLLASAQAVGVVVCLDDRFTGTFGYFEPQHGIVVMNRELETGALAVILVHELRHVDQHARGLGPILSFDMTVYARAHLANEADAQAVMTLFAWRLRQLGGDEAWEAMLAFDRYTDVTAAFEAAIEAGSTEIGATLAAFEAWPESEWRRTTYYQDACMTYLDMLDELHAFRSYGTLPVGFLDGLCTLPDGENYGCEASDAWRHAP